MSPARGGAEPPPARGGGAETGAGDGAGVEAAPRARRYSGARRRRQGRRAKEKADEPGSFSKNTPKTVERQRRPLVDQNISKADNKGLLHPRATTKGDPAHTGAPSILAKLKGSVNVLACLAEHSGDLFQCTDQFKSKKKKGSEDSENSESPDKKK